MSDVNDVNGAAGAGQTAGAGQGSPADIGVGEPGQTAGAGQAAGGEGGLKLNANAGTGEPGQPTDAAQAGGYKDFSFPDGISADAAVMGEFKAIAGKLGLTQEAAQSLIDLQSKQVMAGRQAVEARFYERFDAQEAESGKILAAAGTGALSSVKKGVNWVGGRELAEFFKANPLLSNHPVLVKAFLKIGRALSEDSYPSGAGAKTGESTLGEAWYPNAK